MIITAAAAWLACIIRVACLAWTDLAAAFAYLAAAFAYAIHTTAVSGILCGLVVFGAIAYGAVLASRPATPRSRP